MAAREATAEIAAANELIQEEYRESQRRELERLQADRAGQVIPPRGVASQGRPGLLPGTTAAATPPARTEAVQLPPVTSLLGQTGTVMQAGDATRQAEVTQSVTGPLPAAELPPVAEAPLTTETPPVTEAFPVTETPPDVATPPVTEEAPVAEPAPVEVVSAGQQDQQSPANETETPGVNAAHVEVEPSPRVDPPATTETGPTLPAGTEAVAQPTPVAQQPEPVEMLATPVAVEMEPAARQSTEASVPQTPVPVDDQVGQMQTPTPIVKRPRRKRQVSTTSAPGDLGPEEEASSSASGKIYHMCYQSRIIQGCGLQIRTRRSARRSARDPVQRGWRGTATGCRLQLVAPGLGWTRKPARSTRPTGMLPSTPNGPSRSRACGHEAAS